MHTVVGSIADVARRQRHNWSPDEWMLSMASLRGSPFGIYPSAEEWASSRERASSRLSPKPTSAAQCFLRGDAHR
jgi:hypothetical protein